MSLLRIAVRYYTFRFCVLRISHFEPHGTRVPYFSSIFEAYRTRTITKKGVPYHFAKIEAYLPYLRIVPYCSEVESRTQGSRPRTQKKIRGQGEPFRGQTLSRPRTKDTAASVFQKKRSSKKFFRQSSIYRRSQNF